MFDIKCPYYSFDTTTLITDLPSQCHRSYCAGGSRHVPGRQVPGGKQGTSQLSEGLQDGQGGSSHDLHQ